MTPAVKHVVFIHGLWLHASSWTPWAELFQASGYDPHAPGWPGTSDTVEETRSHADQVAGKGIDDVVDHYAEIIRGLDAPPIVIGHSFGGLIVQRLLGQDLAAAGVAIDPAPIKGVLYLPPSALRVASIALRNPANRNKAISLTPEQFRYGFANALPAQESADLYQRWTVTDLREFNDRGHSLVIDHGWREIADEVLSWLSQRLTQPAAGASTDQ